jgi:hypothetical protein
MSPATVSDAMMNLLKKSDKWAINKPRN